tara:strand:+ start:176 stop:760 length:585 start_codon:yes stop_codon:yes gene_type:complete
MKGHIYKLIDNTNGNVYYGSTTQEINKRENNHKSSYKRYLDGKYNYITSFGIIKNNDYKFELIEENEFETKYDLHQRERYYIENFDCVNKVIPYRTDEENKVKMKEYNKENKEKIDEYQKEWLKKNKERNKETKKVYWEENKEYFKEKRKEWLEKNKNYKEKRKEKITCECGAIIRRDSLTRHKRTKKHLDKII